MKWEELTSPEFEAAVETTKGVCLLPVGVIEKHGDHLPLGQDSIYIHDVAVMAARAEPAVVFPFFYFGQILEARHVPGTIALRPELLIPLFENICDEIGRNGFKKILILNGHGGNSQLLQYFCQLQLGQKKDYMVYMSDFFFPAGAVAKRREANIDGHAGEVESCSMMYLHPELVKPERYADYGLPLARMKAFSDAGLFTGIGWYADYPGHFAGERVKITREKGEAFTKEHAAQIAEQIRLVKEDNTPVELLREFHSRTDKPENRLR